MILDLRSDWWSRLGDDVVVDLAGYGALADALTADRAIEAGGE